MPAACSGPGLAVLGECWLGSRPDVKGKSRQGPGGSENEQKTVPNKTPSSGPSPRPHLPAPCQPGMGNGVTRKPWHVSGVTSSPSKGALRPRPGLGAAWGAGGCARLPPACGTRTLPSPYPPKRISPARCQRADALPETQPGSRSARSGPGNRDARPAAESGPPRWGEGP